jgi:hypothetical protein
MTLQAFLDPIVARPHATPATVPTVRLSGASQSQSAKSVRIFSHLSIFAGPVVSIAIAFGGGGAAQSQVVGRSLANAAEADAVALRPRLAYDAAGLDLGSFVVYPSVETKLTYDDNVYDSAVDRRSDGNLVISPKIRVQSQWARNSLTFAAGADIQRYRALHTENNNQYSFAADGRFDISQAVALSADTSYGRYTEPRGSLGDVVIGGEPGRYDHATAAATATAQTGDVLLTASGGVEYYNYLPIQVGDSLVSQDFQDRIAYTASLRADYSVGPGLRIFVSGSGNIQRYRSEFVGIDQNSHGIAVLTGIAFGLTELISGEVGVGYLSQSYAQPSFGTVAGVTYSGKVVWNPTTLLTLTLNGNRTLQQSPLFDQAGVLEDSVGMKVDYEFLRNFLISLSGTGVIDDYRGIDRHELLYAVDLTGQYLINRVLAIDLDFNHRHESASGTFVRKYSGSSVSLGLTVKK